MQAPAPADAEQLTDTWPADADETELIKPQAVRFSSADGELIPAQLFLPAAHDDIEGPLPAIVWVHGGGIRQNRYGWHPLRAYAAFYGYHQYLVQQGFVVVTVDYRGSIGYGRGTYRAIDYGGLEIEDTYAARNFMIESYDWEFFQPLRPGDIISSKKKILDIYEKKGKSGELIFIITETTYTNQREEVVVIEKGTIIAR